MFTVCARCESAWCFRGVSCCGARSSRWALGPDAAGNAGQKQRLREPPKGLDQSELQHGSVILTNYILIWLCFRNTSPFF